MVVGVIFELVYMGFGVGVGGIVFLNLIGFGIFGILMVIIIVGIKGKIILEVVFVLLILIVVGI